MYYMGDYYAGDPGLFSFIGRAVKGAARIGASLLPGPAGAIARRITAPGPAVSPGVPFLPPAFRPLAGRSRRDTERAEARSQGLKRLPGRRMNFGNAKAARRAVRRITGVRNLLRSIERQLPRRAAAKAKRCR